MKIVGVAACIAGLAHTPMAARSLENAGKKLGHEVKMEQQGAMGIVNELTTKDIEEADIVLYAVDTKIDKPERFKGKLTVNVKIGQAVSHGEQVIKKIVEALEKRKENGE